MYSPKVPQLPYTISTNTASSHDHQGPLFLITDEGRKITESALLLLRRNSPVPAQTTREKLSRYLAYTKVTNDKVGLYAHPNT